MPVAYMLIAAFLFQLLKSQISIPTRDPSGPFLMSVDHCFSIKGQGTVMTGTILSGTISLGDSVEIPALKVSLALTFLCPNPHPYNSSRQTRPLVFKAAGSSEPFSSLLFYLSGEVACPSVAPSVLFNPLASWILELPFSLVS